MEKNIQLYKDLPLREEKHPEEVQKIMEAAPFLLKWFQKEKRDLPWRRDITAYRVWVSEIMLQQTRVEAVKPYYERFMKRLPDVKALAEAPEEDLLKLWEGLGYYSRVRNLQKAAQVCESEYEGRLPDDYEELLGLPGIGSYTAGAVASIAFSIPKPAVDGNVLRVITRILCDETDITKQSFKKQMEIWLEEVLIATRVNPGSFNQALMELGACICVPNGAPFCGECPVRNFCEARKREKLAEIPNKPKKKPRKIEERTIFLVEEPDCIILKKRPEKGLLAGLYEFPSVEGWQSENQVRALWEERLHAPVHVEAIQDGIHIFSHVEWRMKAWRVTLSEPLSSFQERWEALGMRLLTKAEAQEKYALPGAFDTWKGYLKEDSCAKN